MKYYVAIRMNELQLPATAWWISQKKEKDRVKEIDIDESTL